MRSEEKSKITELKKCDFTEMQEYFKAQSEARKQMSKEEKQVSVSLHLNTRRNYFKGILHPKINILSFFTYPHVVPNP